MARVLLTHADQPLGRRVAKTLFHDPQVEALLAIGDGPPPRAFDRFVTDESGRFDYRRAELARHRSVSDLFHSTELRDHAIDTVVHVPRHGPAPDREVPMVAGLSVRTAEARLVLQHALELRSVKSLVALGSAFVYRPPEGNANRLDERSELDLDPEVPPEFRAWIDCDMLFHGEVGAERLRVVMLRVPTVVADGGFVYLNPHLGGRAFPRPRPAGFDPMCQLVADKDVARAVRLAVHATRAGIYNVAGSECVPLSVLARWTRRPTLPVPGPLMGLAGAVLGLLGAERVRAALDGERLRYGFTLDGRRAEHELGYAPAYRIGLARGGDGVSRLETSPT